MRAVPDPDSDPEFWSWVPEAETESEPDCAFGWRSTPRKNGSITTQLSRLLARPEMSPLLFLFLFLCVVTAAIILANFAAQ